MKSNHKRGGEPDGLVVVLDVGKTLAKITLLRRDGQRVARDVRHNQPCRATDYAALDVAGVEAWLIAVLTRFAAIGRIDAIIPAGHGAAAAVIRDGRLACPPIDYEEPIPAAAQAGYDRMRDPFGDTGSPRLPAGLNLGAQLDRLEALRPGLLSGDAQILPWPQYWAWRLSGVMASEVTSLACHSDLWNPTRAAPSQLARSRGWAGRLAPIAPAGAVLGTITAEWAALTGLPADVRIYCGLHDSNAALLAARSFFADADGEMTVLSTGTWFVAMRSPGKGADVDPGVLPDRRDCLMNVDPAGRLIPSARFMGGREIERLIGDASVRPDPQAVLNAVPRLLASGAGILPGFAPGCGPFPDRCGTWIDRPDDADERYAAILLYAALMTDVMLDLIGAHTRIVIEGRFATEPLFAGALAGLRTGEVVHVSDAYGDVSHGALQLIAATPPLGPGLTRVAPLGPAIAAYRADWHRRMIEFER